MVRLEKTKSVRQRQAASASRGRRWLLMVVALVVLVLLWIVAMTRWPAAAALVGMGVGGAVSAWVYFRSWRTRHVCRSCGAWGRLERIDQRDAGYLSLRCSRCGAKQRGTLEEEDDLTGPERVFGPW